MSTELHLRAPRTFFYKNERWIPALMVAVVFFTCLPVVLFSQQIQRFSFQSFKIAQLLSFTITGLALVLLVNFPIPASKISSFILRGSIFISILFTAALFLFYFSGSGNSEKWIFASVACVLFPLVLNQSWRIFKEIPPPKYKLWFNPPVVDKRLPIFLNSLPIRIQLSRSSIYHDAETFSLRASGQTKFGKLFHQFVNEHNGLSVDVIECTDNMQNPYGWTFHVLSFGGLIKKYIDPDLSLRENKVSDHSTIIARRI